MPLIVQKYGGAAVDGPDRIKAVARRIVATRRRGADLVAVVSAMGRTTDEMERLALEVHPSPPRRELDMLVTAGERIAMSLLAMAIHCEGEAAISFTGSQSGIITDTAHGNARIKDVRAFRIQEALARGQIAIVAGYQGVSTAKEVTTLGRGGSDLTAVALAAALHADACELYKDVDGVFTADPDLCPGARCLSEIPAEAMLALSEAGAKVIYSEGVRLAIERGVDVRIRSAFREAPGTLVSRVPLDGGSLYGFAIARKPHGAYALTLVGGTQRLDAFGDGLRELPRIAAPERASPLALRWSVPSESHVRALLPELHAIAFE
jgi:aspartate kinase